MDVMKSNWSSCSQSTCHECILEDTQGLLQLINSRRSGGGQQPAYQDRGSPSRQRTAWQTTRSQSATTQPPLLITLRPSFFRQPNCHPTPLNIKDLIIHCQRDSGSESWVLLQNNLPEKGTTRCNNAIPKRWRNESNLLTNGEIVKLLLLSYCQFISYYPQNWQTHKQLLSWHLHQPESQQLSVLNSN